MDWLRDILKHLAISRTLVVALFVTAGTMFWGSRMAPEVVPALPDSWAPAAFATMVLTACLLVSWVVLGIADTVRGALKKSRATRLSEGEVELLMAMGAHAGESLNLERIDYAGAGIARLELMDTCSSLRSKGLVAENYLNSDIVYLTRAGRSRALELIRERGAKPVA